MRGLDDYITGGNMAGCVEPETIGYCEVCGEPITTCDAYYDCDGVLVCENHLHAYETSLNWVFVG